MADITPLSVHSPSGTPKGAVIVIQEAFGVNDHIEDVCPPVRRRGLAGRGPSPVPPHRRPQARLHRLRRGHAPYAGAHRRTASSPTSTPPSPRSAGQGIAADEHRHRRVLHGRDRDAARRRRSRPRRRGDVLRRRGQGGPVRLPAVGRRGAATCRRRGSGLFGDLDKGIPVDQVEELRAAAATLGPADRDRALPRGRSRLPLRPAGQLPRGVGEATRGARTLEWFDRYLLA